ncbi:hypothetical protein QRX50_30215 [Amycolatopsis carbonis]|uniref:Pectate lyase n=1 Tax=Amycolatopsis carbonis TaxID=715471 RepID=A0A9Y2MUJ5_9PSEU|nr:hypothetical protein [Amycolatopsis sp. 2-15]WIX75747.1 hypothetical protein QRX50_30215 [Amycolatopsis sp. 2-15]
MKGTTLVRLAALAVVLAGVCAPASAAALPAAGRLKITEGGTPEHPRVHSGAGRQVSGIDVETDWVVVDGFTLTKPSAPGVELDGNHVTLQNTTITDPHGGDGDGIGQPLREGRQHVPDGRGPERR